VGDGPDTDLLNAVEQLVGVRPPRLDDAEEELCSRRVERTEDGGDQTGLLGAL